MNTIRKTLSLILAGLLMGSLLLACNQTPQSTTVTDEQKTATTTMQTTTVAGKAETFVDLDEEDRILSVLYTEGQSGDLTQRSLKTDMLNESDVDVATRARDARLKEQLGLELDIVATDGINNMESYLGNSVATGLADWDILAGYQYYGISLAKKGYLLNLKDLASQNADYIDLEADYWAKQYNDAMSYKGAYYWITGDMALRYIGGAYCTYVNDAIYKEKLDAYYGSIYDIAKEGKWTLDLLIEMAARCYEDSGDVEGEPDAQDTIGFGWEANDIIDGMAYGAGAVYTYTDPATGEVAIAVNNQHTIDISQKLNTLAKIGGFSYRFEDMDSGAVMNAFANGTIAFTVNKLFCADPYLDDMEDGYCIIPVPKYDETQEDYITGVHESCTIFGIYYGSQKVPQAAAALEFLCAYSSDKVAYLYYEAALKGRYTRDPDAAAMIDLIHRTTTTQFGVAWSNEIGNLSRIFRDCDVISSGTLLRRMFDWSENLSELTPSLEEYADQ